MVVFRFPDDSLRKTYSTSPSSASQLRMVYHATSFSKDADPTKKTRTEDESKVERRRSPVVAYYCLKQPLSRDMTTKMKIMMTSLSFHAERATEHNKIHKKIKDALPHLERQGRRMYSSFPREKVIGSLKGSDVNGLGLTGDAKKRELCMLEYDINNWHARTHTAVLITHKVDLFWFTRKYLFYAAIINLFPFSNSLQYFN